MMTQQHWMIAFGLHKVSEPPKRKDTAARWLGERRDKVFTAEQKDRMCAAILDHIGKQPRSSHIEMYFDLDDAGLIPEFKGKKMQMCTFSNHVTNVKRKNGFEMDSIKNRVIKMFAGGMTETEISNQLGQEMRYVRRCLSQDGLIKLRRKKINML